MQLVRANPANDFVKSDLLDLCYNLKEGSYKSSDEKIYSWNKKTFYSPLEPQLPVMAGILLRY